MTCKIPDTTDKELQSNWVVKHFTSPMSETTKKVVPIASFALSIAGSAMLITAGSHVALMISISPLSLYIAGAALLVLGIYLGARRLCSKMSYNDFLVLLKEDFKKVKEAHTHLQSCLQHPSLNSFKALKKVTKLRNDLNTAEDDLNTAISRLNKALNTGNADLNKAISSLNKAKDDLNKAISSLKTTNFKFQEAGYKLRKDEAELRTFLSNYQFR